MGSTVSSMLSAVGTDTRPSCGQPFSTMPSAVGTDTRPWSSCGSLQKSGERRTNEGEGPAASSPPAGAECCGAFCCSLLLCLGLLLSHFIFLSAFEIKASSVWHRLAWSLLFDPGSPPSSRSLSLSLNADVCITITS